VGSSLSRCLYQFWCVSLLPLAFAVASRIGSSYKGKAIQELHTEPVVEDLSVVRPSVPLVLPRAPYRERENYLPRERPKDKDFRPPSARSISRERHPHYIKPAVQVPTLPEQITVKAASNSLSELHDLSYSIRRASANLSMDAALR
jgi:hypothetical protein